MPSIATVMVPLAWISLNRSPDAASAVLPAADSAAGAVVAALLPQAVRASAAVRARAVSLVRFFITIGSFACRFAKILWCGAAAGR